MTVESEKKGLSRIAIRGTGWNFTSYFSGKLLSLLTTVILARLLTKDDFGLVAYAITFISFLEIMNSFGIGPSVIYHKESEEISNAAFWLTFGFGLTIYLLIFLMAPLAGVFFNDARVVPVIRVLGLSIPFDALGGAHSFLLQKKMAFGLKFIPDLTRSIAKGVISIGFAFMGYGPWSLVWGQVGGIIVATLVLWIIFPWRPAFMIDTTAIRSLLSYGFKIVGVDLVSLFASNIDYLFVGRYLGSEVLGVYTLAFRLPDLLVGGFARIIGDVTFPIFAHMRDVTGNVSRGFYATTRYVSLITVPLGVGLALVARPLILVVFTDKWIDLVPIMQALAIFATINTLTYNVGTLLKAEGYPQIITWLEFGHLILLVPAFIWAVILMKSVIAVAWMHALVALFLSVSTIFIAEKKLNISWGGVLESMFPSFLALVPMTLIVLLTLHFSEQMGLWPQLILAILSGIITYSSVLWLFQRELMNDAMQMVLKAVAK